MKRIIVAGVSGSGKTYTAKAISTLLDIPHFDLDNYYWEPGWQDKDRQEFNDIVNALTEKDCWIISGNFSNTEMPIFKRCDYIIWLDYSIFRCLAQSFMRSIRRIIKKEPCCNGNFETFKQLFFSKNSIIAWVLTSYNKRRDFYNMLFVKDIQEKTFLRFSSPKETNIWLKTLHLLRK
jgi:adenylate kinase family enzyme